MPPPVPSPYDLALRERVVRALDRGASADEVAERFEVGVATVRRWRRRRCEQGSLAPTPRPARGSVLDEHADWLAELRAGDPSLSCRAICERLADEHRLDIHETTLWYWLRRHGYTHKKTP